MNDGYWIDREQHPSEEVSGKAMSRLCVTTTKKGSANRSNRRGKSVPKRCGPLRKSIHLSRERHEVERDLRKDSRFETYIRCDFSQTLGRYTVFAKGWKPVGTKLVLDASW